MSQRHVTKFGCGLRGGNDKKPRGVFNTLSLESQQWFGGELSTAKGRTRYRKHISRRRI
jgi:hypothetical protein